MAYIEFKDVIKAYGEGDARIHALDGASFTVERGELAIILGASGARQDYGAQHPGWHGYGNLRHCDGGRARRELR